MRDPRQLTQSLQGSNSDLMVVKTPNSVEKKNLGIHIVDHSKPSGAFEVDLKKSAEFTSSYSFNRLEPNFKSHPASTPMEQPTPVLIGSPPVGI